MKPQDLRDLIGRMTPGEWAVRRDTANGWQVSGAGGQGVCIEAWHGGVEHERFAAQYDADATGIATLRNLAPALVELWEAVERWADATKDCEDGCGCRQGQDAVDALLAAAKRVVEV